jgi:hypothetical protein
MRFKSNGRFIDLLYLMSVLALSAFRLDFTSESSLNVTSLYNLSEFKARAQFGESNAYNNDLFYIHPLIHFFALLVWHPAILTLVFTLMSIYSCRAFIATIDLKHTSAYLFAVLFYLNPFLYQQIYQLDTRLFDLFIIAFILKHQIKSSLITLGCLFGILIHLRTQNFIVFTLAVNLNGKAFELLFAISLISFLILLLFSRLLTGDFVF